MFFEAEIGEEEKNLVVRLTEEKVIVNFYSETRSRFKQDSEKITR